MSGFTRRSVILTATASLIAGCSGGGIWPFGGRGAAGTAAGSAREAGPGRQGPSLPADAANTADGSALLPVVRFAAAERGRQGIILRVEGLAPMQGYHSPELRPVGRGEDGVEIVELRARPPLAAQPVGPERTRLIQVARFYPPHLLRDIRAFRVVAAQNAVAASVS